MATTYYYQNDTQPYFRATLTRGGVAIDLTASTVSFKMYRKGREAYDSPLVSGAAVVVGAAANGIAEYQWAAAELDLYGSFSGIFVIDNGTGDEGVPDGGYIDIVVRPAAS